MEESSITDIINCLEYHRKHITKEKLSKFYDNKTINNIYLAGIFTYAVGAYIAIFCSIFNNIHRWMSLTGLFCVAIGVICFIISALFQLKEILASIIDPLSTYLPGLRKRILAEEALIAGLTVFKKDDLNHVQTRLEFEKKVISNRVMWFLGSTSKIAVVPIVALGCYIVISFWEKIPLTPSLGALALAGIFGLSFGALIVLHISNVIDDFIYCLKEAKERASQGSASVGLRGQRRGQE